MHYPFSLQLAFFFPALVIGSCVQAQFNDRLFGIHNPEAGVYHFSSIDRGTGAISDLEQLPISFYGGLASLTVDPDLQRIIFNTASGIYILDPTGNTPFTTVVPPLESSSFFGPLQRDPCSGNYYGFRTGADGSVNFIAYDLSNNSITSLSEIVGLNGFSEMSYIDPALGNFVIEHAQHVMVIDLDDGSVLSNSPVIVPSGHIFHGITYECSSRRTFGTLASLNDDHQKWLGEIDVTTGEVSFVSENGTSLGYLKPSSAGACLVQDEGVYIWEGTGGIYVNANTATGEFEPAFYASDPAQVLDIVHYSTCACATNNVVSVDTRSDLKPYPNPTTGTVNFQIDGWDPTSTRFRWLDALGNELAIRSFSTVSNVLRWDLSGQPSGVYTLSVRANHGPRAWRVVLY